MAFDPKKSSGVLRSAQKQTDVLSASPSSEQIQELWVVVVYLWNGEDVYWQKHDNIKYTQISSVENTLQ